MDPGLAGVGGHYYSLNLAIAKRLRNIGIDVITYGKQGAVILDEDLNFKPTFRFDVFQEMPAQSATSHIVENFFTLNKMFFEDLNAINGSELSGDDVVYFGGITQNQINAVADWILNFPKNSRPQVIITLRFLNSRMLHNLNRGFAPQIEYLYHQSLQRLKQVHNNTILVADTEELCQAYRTISGLDVTLVPEPLGGFPFHETKNKLDQINEDIKVLYIGNISPYKGLELLPEIAEKILSATEKTNFVIQINADPSSDKAQLMRPVFEKFPERIKLIYGALSMSDYLDTMKSADIVLLPYHPAYYSFGGSGVFIEAASMGKVVVVTAGTFIDGQAKQHDLPVCFAQNYTSESFVSALLSGISDFARLNKLAKISCPQFSSHNSPNNLIKNLLRLL
jgi:glycosyltransferase involved in cell wall biosynthesis